MRKLVVPLFVCIFITISIAQWPVTRCQNDWHLGTGLSDTTDVWTSRYFTGGAINDAMGSLMLLADPATFDPLAWVSHTVDNIDEIGTFTWCVRPANINGDEYPDIVANISDNTESATGRVVWYEDPDEDWTYTIHDIYTYSAIDRVSGSFPADIDNDGDIDVVAGDGVGLYWFENNGTGGGWAQHTIYTTAYDEYHGWYYDVADADGDGWKDVLMTEVEINYGFLIDNIYTYCTIYWNTGSGPDYFDWSGGPPGGNTLVSSWGDNEGQFWRSIFFDADPADGFLDVAYERVSYEPIFGGFDADSLIVEVQNPARTFTYAYSHYIDAYYSGMGHDGLWNNDFDGDGDEDLVVATADNDCATILGCDDNGYFFLVQTDPGDIFTFHWIVDDPFSSYGDGAIMFDMDGDGMTDVAGTCDSLGYYRRWGAGYTDFNLYAIDNIPGTGYMTHYASHWIFPYNLDRGECSGDADIDIVVVFDNGTQEEIRIYENQMFNFFMSGSLYSAILGIPLPTDTCITCSLYWEGCQIPEYTIDVAGRVGQSVVDCQGASWGTISHNPFHEVGFDHGWHMGDIHSSVDTAWVQYFIRITRTGGEVDLSPLIDSVCVKVFTIPCECESILAQWVCPVPCWSFSSCSTQVMQLIMWTDSTAIDTSRTYFTVDNDIGTPFPIFEGTYPSNLDFTCLTPNCDSVFVEISGFWWTDGATVTISLDSAYTDDGCFTVWFP